MSDQAQTAALLAYANARLDTPDDEAALAEAAFAIVAALDLAEGVSA